MVRPLVPATRSVDYNPDDIDFAQRFDCGIHHAHVHPVQRAMDAGRIDEDGLPFGIVLDPHDAVARRLGFIGDDCELLADDAVQEGRFAGVRPSDERDESGFHPRPARPMPDCPLVAKRA
jgi:hypothetical protein